jgi:hypothetical protein
MTTTNLESSYEAALQAKEATESKVMSAIFANDTDGINKYRKDLEGYKQTVAELKNSIENSAKEESYQKQVEQKKEEERQDSIEKAALRFLDPDEKPKAQPQVTVAIPTSLSNVKSTVDSGSTEPQKPAVKSASSSSEANT